MEKLEQPTCSDSIAETSNVENIEAEDDLTNETEEDIDTTIPAGLHSTLPHISQNALVGWTKDEKFLLYLGIKFKGHRNVQAIKENIPTKTIEEIKKAIAYYKSRAKKTQECTQKKLKVKKQCKTKSLIPLAKWAKLLRENFSHEQLQDNVVKALRLIADLDNIPPPAWTEQIDFRQAYHQIADAMEGKSLTETEYITEVLHSCIFETCLASKSFIQSSVFHTILNNINFKEPPPTFPRITKNCEFSILRDIVSLQNYNPLGIPIENLKPSSTKQDGNADT